MNFYKYALAVLIVIFSICIAGWKITKSGERDQKAENTPAITELVDTINKFMTRQKIPGLAITVSQNEHIIWTQGFGYADIENEVPIDPSKTKFRIASLSKPLTSAALGLLYQKGKLKFDDEVQEYVPYFPRKRYRLSIRQVAGHMGGIRHYRDREFLSFKRYFTVQSAISVFGNDPLEFQPGTSYKYSSYGWNLISAVIEGASEQNFLVFMKNQVFDQLDMNNTTADFQDSIITGRTRFYSLTEDSVIVNAPYVDLSNKWAGGGFLSTSEDLIKFANALLSNKFLADSVKQQLLTSQHLNNGRKTGYGMGWSVKTDKHGRHCFGHSGSAFGGRAIMMVYPDEKMAIVITTNSTHVKFDGFEGDLVHYILGLGKYRDG